ncbi:DUF3742 family protein [Pseudomonas cichorii]|uniref:DUF3742 family protein n=1 Tax=Pseudomonas cichorii TaxID=36746 RepID=UPI0018E6419E|nr:DUF3742 family protein [Pseudomonas cichorii]MBI6856094.1 DUF3742 family protein [Pseudomonas cichorii]
MTTNTTKQGSSAMRLGQTLGRGAARMLRMERALWSGVSKVGLPALVVTPLKWAARLGAAVLVLWGALYVVPVVVFMAVLVGIANHESTEDLLREALIRNRDSDEAFRKSALDVVSNDEKPYGTVTNIFGQTKGWFQSDDKYH